MAQAKSTDARNGADKTKEQEKRVRLEKAKERMNMTLFRNPIKTLYYFSLVLLDAAKFPVKWAVNPSNRVSVVISVLVLIIILALRTIEGAHTPLFKITEHYFWYFTWWFGLGVASSIGILANPQSTRASSALDPTAVPGLGTGAHTGTLFMFPHICAVVRTAERRKAFDFDPT